LFNFAQAVADARDKILFMVPTVRESQG